MNFMGGNTMRRIGWKRVQSDLIKGHSIHLRLKKHTPKSVVADILKRWGQWLEIGSGDDKWVSLSNDTGFQEFVQKQTPGAWLAGLRGAHGLTQKELGEKLGNVSPARISDWEHDRRAVSKTIAKQLALIFRVNAELFL